MKFKLDENFGTRTQEIFRLAGHDVQTVFEQNMQGASDQHIYEICCSEKRCLVTLDLDFSNVIRFPPTETSGIIVIRIRRNPTNTMLEQLIRQVLKAINQRAVENELWIVEFGRIRIHQNEQTD
jgi:predicted nuclease of predicted toxin-antitoxin system